MSSSTTVDAIIVGGGPCGLTLAKGFLEQGYSIVLIEKESFDLESHDWSKAYSFRVDVRGLRLLKSLGLCDKLTGAEQAEPSSLSPELQKRSITIGMGVKSEGFKGTKWLPDGNFAVLPLRTLGSVGYWIMRPKFLRLLNEAVPDEHKILGQVASIEFEHGTVMVSLEEGEIARGKYLFGCDGIHSQVRTSLEAIVDKKFQVSKIDCPSAGLTFRATLYDPPESLDPNETYMIMGRTGDRLLMMPYGGTAGQPRPIAVSSQSTFRFFQAKTEKALYDMLDEEFPQLQVRTRLSSESATAWIMSDGSTFPRPRWAGKACCIYNGVFACILGDALHSFPPDLGQGLNSGMVDVERVLLFMKNRTEPFSTTSVASLNEDLVSEADAVCQLLPVGMPYQYKMPFSMQKVWFFADFMARLALHRIVSKTWFHAPAILEIQDDPPKKYVTILEHHRQTSRRMLVLFGTLGTAIVGSCCFLPFLPH